MSRRTIARLPSSGLVRRGEFALLLVAAAAALPGCMMAGLTPQRDELKMAVQELNDGIRWGKPEQAAAHLPLPKRHPFAERYASLEDELEVMDYEIQRIDFDARTGKAQVRVDLTWSLKRRGLVERTVVDEEWVRDRGWYMVSSKRVKGSPLPVFE